MMYSDNTLVLTNAGINERRKSGHDVGRPYLSESSLVYHFDTNMLNQKQETQCEISYETEPPALVGREDNTDLVPIDFTPAILAVSPFSEVGKSLYGQYSLKHPVGSGNTWTVDFWIQYIWAEDQVLFTVGTEHDALQLINSRGEPDYNAEAEGEPKYNAETNDAASVVYNVAKGQGNFLMHSGMASSALVELDKMGIKFVSNTWLHFGVVMTEEKITAYLNDQKIEYDRYSAAPEAAEARLNESRGSFILDELMIDPDTAEAFEDFAETTANKVPFGALDWREKWFVIDAENLANIRTNLWDAPSFKEAVRTIIREENAG